MVWRLSPLNENRASGRVGPRVRLSNLQAFTALALMVATWVTAHSAGIIHDARFYTIQALDALNTRPSALGIHFQFGSQGALSPLAPLFAVAVAALAPASANVATSALGEPLWHFAAVAANVPIPPSPAP